MKTLLALLLLFPGLSVLSAPATWPQFHGPNACGIAPDDKAAPAVFGLDTNLLWKTALPPGHSSPCVWGDRIFVTAYQKEARTLETLCLDRGSGRILWRQATRPEKVEKVHRISSPATATPATDGKSIFVYFGSHGLLAYDFEGHLRWERKLPRPVIMLEFGSGTSPVVAGDKVILDVQIGADSHVLAVRSTDGETVWKAEKPTARGWATPVIWREGAADCVGVFNAGRFTAYDLRDGKERWWLSGAPNQVCATPVVGEGVLFLNGTGVYGESENIIAPPAFREALTKYDANKDGLIGLEEIPKDVLYVDRKNSASSGNQRLRDMMFRGKKTPATLDRKEWDGMVERLGSFVGSAMMSSAVLAVRVGGQGDVKDTHVVWTQPKGVPEVPSLLLYQNLIYGVKSGGVLTCRDSKNGRALFEERLDASGGYFASPVGAGGRIYTASDLGVITVLQAGDRFQVIGRVDLKEPIQATPAILDGKIYVRTDKHLLAFGE